MNPQNVTLNSIEEALEDLKKGKIIIVVDDENRENEGDFIAASEKITPEMINFMARYGRGLICNALTYERCETLNLPMMVEENTVLHNTQFTVSVDLIGQGCTTGISVSDRAKTILALVDEKTKAFYFFGNFLVKFAPNPNNQSQRFVPPPLDDFRI